MIDHQPPFPVIDSHHHLWELQRGDYSWLTPKLPTLYKDFTMADYQQVTCNKIAQSIVVQAADTENETDYLLQLADQNNGISGVVGWVDMLNPNCVQRLESLARNSYFKGIRPMLQEIEDTDWILNPDFDSIFKKMIALDLSFDALIQPRHLKNLHQIACKYPQLLIVIDHCAKPDIAENSIELWIEQLQNFKPCSNVFIKFSGLTTEANLSQNSAKDYSSYFNYILKVFGHERVMWGSDWPVVNLKSDFQQWCMICQQLTDSLSNQQKNQFWNSTAKHFYRL